MDNIKLYIGGKIVDYPSEVTPILFTRQRTDYTNPTIVKNSFTKTIKLPGTDNNNRLFNHIWKLDRTQWTGAYNPSKREEFMLFKNGALSEKGYVKLNNIVWDGTFYTYEITLYGELGNILYGLSYKEDPETEESIPMNLGDLDFGFNYFNISKDFVEAAWTRLKDGTGSENFETINFMVSYDGVPQANNFDPKKVLVSVGSIYTDSDDIEYGTRQAKVVWGNTTYNPGHFPAMYKDGTKAYQTIPSGIARMDPMDFYGLCEVGRELTPLEVRDLRAYLLRPVVRVKKLFEAIGTYINQKFGYTLDISDPFFSTDEFTKAWITLSMLYEVDPNVETNTKFTKEKLFSNTGSPASYLVSYCKTYGIYLDVDFINKTLTIKRLPTFFGDGSLYYLQIDMDSEIKVNPLSFDKASYTFDYGEGDGVFLNKYKDTYGVQYGSKKVNTGYSFDASSKKYIDNNIFKEAVDTIEQSIYYKYGVTTYPTGNFEDYPGILMNQAEYPPYTLVNRNDPSDTYTQNMTPMFFGSTPADTVMGYQFIDPKWLGLEPDVFQDTFPKVQFHSEDNKGIDGKDVLVWFNGFYQGQYGRRSYSGGKYSFNRMTTTDYEYVKYLISDDSYGTKEYVGKNCYYDNPSPDVGYIFNTFADVVTELPSFTRCKYDLTQNTDKYPAIYVNNWGQYNMGSIGDAMEHHLTGDYFVITVDSTSYSSRQCIYFNVSGLMKSNHRYFLASLVKASDSSVQRINTNNEYNYPDVMGNGITSTLVNKKGIAVSDYTQIIGSIIDSGNNGSSLFKFAPLTTYVGNVELYVYYMVIIDLTELGLADSITTVDTAISHFGLTTTRAGYKYNLNDTLDFSLPREIYVPACTVTSGTGIYNKYWSKYISDVYSVTTRVMDCYVYLQDIDQSFRDMFWYDGCYWILSKVTDWTSPSKLCKCTFIKVNKRSNYIS